MFLMTKKKTKSAVGRFAYISKDGEIVQLQKFENLALVEYDITVSPSTCLGVYVADCETYKNEVVGVNKTAVWSLATTPAIPMGSYSYADVNTITDFNNDDCIGEWLNYILSRAGADYLIKLKEDIDYSIYMVDDDIAYLNFKTIPDNMLQYVYYVGTNIYLHFNVINVYFHNLDFDGNFIGAYIEENAEKLGLAKEYTVTTEFYMKQNAYSMLYSNESRNFIYLAIRGTGNTVLFMKDSANLVSGSLKEVANDFDTQYKKLDMDYDEHKPGEELTEEMKKYIANDVLALAEIVYGLLTNGMVQLTATSFAHKKLKEFIGPTKFYQLFPNQYGELLLKNEMGYILPLKADGTLDELSLLSNLSENIVRADSFVRDSYKGGLVLLRDNKIKSHVTDDDVYVQSDLTKGLKTVKTGKGVALDCTSMYPYIMHSKSGTYFPTKHPIYVYSQDELNYTYTELYEMIKDGVKITSEDNIKTYINNTAYMRGIINLLKKLDWEHPDTAMSFLSKNMGSVKDKDIPFDYDYLPVYRFIKFKCSFRLKDDGIPCVLASNIGSQSTSFLRCNKSISSFGNIVELTLTQIDFELFVENYNIEDFEALQMIEYEAKIGLFDDFVNKYFEAKQKSKGVHRALNKSILNNSMGRMGKKQIDGVSIPYIDEKGRLAFKLDESIKVGQVYAYVPVAAALTSAARKYVIYGIKNLFPTTFNYTDTDSLKIEESLEIVEKKVKADKLFKLGRDLGEWKNDLGDGVEFDKAIYLKLKTYACTVDTNFHITAAGITRRAVKLMEEYFKLSSELINIEDIEEYIALIEGVIKQLNLSSAEYKWFESQILDDIKLRQDRYKGDISIGMDKFELGYEAPPQLKAKRVAGGVILDYENQCI